MHTFSINNRALTLCGLSNSEQAISLHQDDVVIACHGWQDNSASFAPLMRELSPQLPLYAFDWPGHGLSQWRHPQAHYYFIDYVDDLHQVITQCQAQRVHLVGHSLGAMVASLYVACFPEHIASLTLIEGIGLVCAEPEEAKALLMRALAQRARGEKIREYPSTDDLVARRLAISDFDEPVGKELMARNIEPGPEGGVRLRTDPRIKHYSAFRYSEAQAHALLDTIDVPTLLIKGTEGYSMVHQNEHKFAHHYSQLSAKVVAGGHHCHMQSALECAQLIGAHLHQSGAR
ncbi:alpha/beta fold hydrolase [Pseudoalteromonas sp. T1lg75]|uniref:alpha/beta fold hydrolase n=1 Tax=Pseudoalteromonas sp. T1lg75 TaxID=2077102 RepID=UPI000CF70200|nr:alpha/beta hydrolase [Pseudoalteromonas sp. T1lg75]